MVVTMLGLVVFGVLMAAVAYRQEQKRAAYAAHKALIERLHAPSKQQAAAKAQGRRIVATTEHDREAA